MFNATIIIQCEQIKSSMTVSIQFLTFQNLNSITLNNFHQLYLVSTTHQWHRKEGAYSSIFT